MKPINFVYYQIKPLLPRRFQIWLRSSMVRMKRERCKEIWPILERSAAPPGKWSGWPGGKTFALVLTHDVDTAAGQTKCLDLMRLEQSLGFRSSFNFVPERYDVSAELRRRLDTNGFEIGVHGLNHDGKLFQSKRIFDERSGKINRYLREWNAVGFRSPAMHHNLEWIQELEIEYDASTFDTDPFEPQSDGIESIFPFKYTGNGPCRGYIELPYTLPQDFTLFVLMKEIDVSIWRRKLDWIAGKGGMALVVTHPDYMSFCGKPGMEEYPVRHYSELLKCIAIKYHGSYWHALPREMAQFWSSIS
ncbi:MAG: hypothetical protein V1736_11955 [Pseudomonadota bacterium]